MIIECQSCHARFRLDEAKIKGKGARVRCRRCGESIMVFKPPEAETPAPAESAGDSLDLRSAVADTPGSFFAPPPAEAAPAPPEPPAAAEPEPPRQPEPLPLTDMPIIGKDEGAGSSPVKDEVDIAFEQFLGTGMKAEEALPEPVKEEPAPAESPIVDFRPEEKMEFSFGQPEEPRLELMDIGSQPTAEDLGEGTRGTSGAPPAQEGERFDISASLRREPDAEPSESPAAPLPPVIPILDIEPPRSESVEETAMPSPPPAETPAAREAVRPRQQEIRRSGPTMLQPSMVALILLFVALAGGGAFLGFTKSGQDMLRNLVPGMESLWLRGKGTPGPQYDVRNLIGYYEQDTKAGKLFVIKGQVTNAGRSRKSGIRIVAALLDDKDRTVAEKTCYAGNVLSGDTLRTSEREKIDAAMINRFGDGLVNMDVAPGKSVPFMVVFFDAPDGINAYKLEAKDGD